MSLSNLQFSFAEFVNIVIGGILTGIVSATFYTILTNWISRMIFEKAYGGLTTISVDRDWQCFEMKDNQFSNRIPIPSHARVTVYNRKIAINILQTNDNRAWNGILTILGPNWGKLNFRYINELEVGFKDCFIGYFGENGTVYDYIYLIPNEPGYGKELLLREAVTKSNQS